MIRKLVEEVRKYKDWNFTVYFWYMKSPVGKENSIWGEKYKIRCLWT
jgi:hypothetical protein